MIFFGGIFFLAMAASIGVQVLKAKSPLAVHVLTAAFGICGCVGMVLIAIGLNANIH